MGLDMYLTARRSTVFWHDSNESSKLELAVKELFPETEGMDLTSIEVTAIYWRKANAIHRWFVENVQDGKDDCGSYPVSRELLEELLLACNQVLDDPDRGPELLPTGSGFFFGSTDYDDWYIRDIRMTRDRLNIVLDDCKFSRWDFSYQASW